jgi:hypothetical protein
LILISLRDRGSLVAGISAGNRLCLSQQRIVIAARAEYVLQLIQTARILVRGLGENIDRFEATVIGNVAAGTIENVHRSLGGVADLRIIHVRMDPALAFVGTSPGVDAVAYSGIDEGDRVASRAVASNVAISVCQEIAAQLRGVFGKRQPIAARIVRRLGDDAVNVGGLSFAQRAAGGCAQRPRAALAQIDLDGADAVTAVLRHRAGLPPLRSVDAGHRKPVKRGWATALGAAADSEVHRSGERIQVARIDIRHDPISVLIRIMLTRIECSELVRVQVSFE